MRALLLIAFIFWSSSASALCAYKYPGCTQCTTFAQTGDKVRPVGCNACGGFCQPFLTSTDVQREIGSKTQARVSEGVLFSGPAPTRATSYIVDIPRDQLMAIGQVNPMAAIALLLFTKEFRAESANPVTGEVSFGRIPTFSTVVQAAQGADERSLDDSQNPLPSGVAFVRVKWSSVRSERGLQMTLFAQRMDEQGVPMIGDIYPPIVVMLERGQPGLISSWVAQ